MNNLKDVIGGIGKAILNTNQLDAALRNSFCQPTATASEKKQMEAALDALPELAQQFVQLEDLKVTFEDFFTHELAKFLLPNGRGSCGGNSGGGNGVQSGAKP